METINWDGFEYLKSSLWAILFQKYPNVVPIP